MTYFFSGGTYSTGQGHMQEIQLVEFAVISKTKDGGSHKVVGMQW